MTRPLAVFGLSSKPEWPQRVFERLGVRPRSLSFGSAGTLFLFATGADLAESDDAVALCLGSLRSSSERPGAADLLCAEQLLERRLVTPGSVDGERLRGNALVVCVDKKEPRFAAYQTLLAMPQLYYCALSRHGLGDGVLASSDLPCLLRLLDRPELDEASLPLHFLFRAVPGPGTYFRGVERLYPGRLLLWRHGSLHRRRLRDLRPAPSAPSFDRIDQRSVRWLEGRLTGVMDAYLRQAEASGRRPATLLSGGEDSSVLQCLIHDDPTIPRPMPTYSFAVAAPSFDFEVANARQASELLATRHHFVQVTAEDYPRLLVRAIRALGQPTLWNDCWPCMLALADDVRARVGGEHRFFCGNGADTLYGEDELFQIALAEKVRDVPPARWLLRGLLRLSAGFLARRSPERSYSMGAAAEMMANRGGDPARLTPTSYVGLAGELRWAERCFGERALAEAFRRRCDLEAELLAGDSLAERVQTIDLLCAGYDSSVVQAQLFAACGEELVQFYLDEDVIRTIYAFHPAVRYRQGRRVKPLQKAILERRSLRALVGRAKGGTHVNDDMFRWMTRGPLRDLVAAIEPPAFLPRSLFHEMLEKPNDFLWSLVVFDLFDRHVLGRRGH